ncbi:hypothetical protein AA309_26485 [Microvirga vignae]|uniref:Uncharacterized protein n=1 Tax=Microvirga vignae TaxID=1225564 RepID=A0A0H1R5M1_9HYPH|nr:hypothetical protein [Microvirga vignae]KLK90324.1 hypothetical protein AA309_26485 [Microvirga vignae]
MSRLFTTLGVSVVALGTLMGSVEAKTVFYEINGQRYSYDTNNRRQAAAARKQIEAAKVAEAAKAKAAAERASNPLVAVFGSQIQREAAEAQAQLEKILSDRQQAAAASRDQRSPAAIKDESVARPAKNNASEPTGITAAQQTTADSPDAAPPSAPNIRDPAEPARTGNTRKAPVKSVFLDAETGIKTIIRTDGSIQEELFDPGLLSRLDPEHRSVGAVSNVAGADQLPRPSPEDTTGSTSLRGISLRPNSRFEVRGQSLAN